MSILIFLFLLFILYDFSSITSGNSFIFKLIFFGLISLLLTVWLLFCSFLICLSFSREEVVWSELNDESISCREESDASDIDIIDDCFKKLFPFSISTTNVLDALIFSLRLIWFILFFVLSSEVIFSTIAGSFFDDFLLLGFFAFGEFTSEILDLDDTILFFFDVSFSISSLSCFLLLIKFWLWISILLLFSSLFLKLFLLSFIPELTIVIFFNKNSLLLDLDSSLLVLLLNFSVFFGVISVSSLPSFSF